LVLLAPSLPFPLDPFLSEELGSLIPDLEIEPTEEFEDKEEPEGERVKKAARYSHPELVGRRACKAPVRTSSTASEAGADADAGAEAGVGIPTFGLVFGLGLEPPPGFGLVMGALDIGFTSLEPLRW
jgi:hypothetical protein